MSTKQINTNSPLPPLGSFKTDKNLEKSFGSKELTELMSIIAEGPFRKPLHNIEKMEISSPSSTQSNVDPNIFLKDLSTLDPEIIFSFLKKSPKILDSFVEEHVSIEMLELWLGGKTYTKFQDNISLASLVGYDLPSSTSWKNTSSFERQRFMGTFFENVHGLMGDVHGTLLTQIANCCASVLDAADYVLYLADESAKSIWTYSPESITNINLQTIKEGSTLPCYVAATLETVICEKPFTDQRFPHGVNDTDENIASILCSPIILPHGDLAGILQLNRAFGTQAFTEKDNQIVNGYLAWGGIALHYAEMFQGMQKQRKLNDFLLSVTRSIFQDIVSMDKVIMKIMNFAQTLVDADRTSLFLVDTKTEELYARIFDIGIGLDTKLRKEIRFPKSKGVAGYVATTGETLNIKKAYDDPRFNREIDQQTGYTTHSLLCMPIFIRGNIIGVVQMVNKKKGVFTPNDEKAFQTFAVYCGLALHHAKLYDKIRRSEQKYKVALEVLSYHSTCNENEIWAVRNCEKKTKWEDISRFEFNAFDLKELEMASISIDLFRDLFQSDSRFDLTELTRFVLTVRKNYRRVPYHNWTHAFTVAHCMYCVVKSSAGIIDGLEAVALYVACLCHDLDHRGKNNEWMKVEGTPLASVYTTSTLEHHHFNQTVTILQHEGHNIFSQLSQSEYKRVLATVRDCILATDLAQFFGNKAKLFDIVKKNEFNWKLEEHRAMMRALAMTCCDLSACAKPWKTQYETVKVIFQEFYAQGDEEKALGRTPVPMMDRDTADKLPNHQVGFLVGICVPGYELLAKLIPGTVPLVDGAKKNLSVWNAMVKKQNEEKEKNNHENVDKEHLAVNTKDIQEVEKSNEQNARRKTNELNAIKKPNENNPDRIGNNPDDSNSVAQSVVRSPGMLSEARRNKLLKNSKSSLRIKK
ncbi:probable 3',5'-cyclic phosphodiesterase pde-5 isoform X1 [Hydra vulgaris]|uniref:probable 3',5'-cyclic phosphodiesterase pde-5 isoform X1 n=2 Tax=Hydra vulgaris TaxID=6087 RepID=UPI001F5ED6EE|nr:probable 3',5'-cyclic phosphodiesterase pde-5 [Hydra vulgaris]